MAYPSAFDALDIQLVIGGRLYKPDDIGLFRLLIAFEEDGDCGVELHCVDNDYSVADSVDFQPGNLLAIRWGYRLSQDYSDNATHFVIQKPSTDYGEDGVVSIVKAYTKSGLLSAMRPQKVYNSRTLGDIVKDVAGRAQMDVLWNSAGAGQEVVPSISHSTWSDRQLLSVLADRYGYQVSYQGNTIVFDRITYSETPVHSLLYRKGEDSIIRSANVSMDAKKNAGATMATSFDPKTKESKTVEGKEAAVSLAVSAIDGLQAFVAPALGQTPANAATASSPGSSGLMQGMAKLMGVPAMPNIPDPLAAPEAKNLRTLLSQPDVSEAISQSNANAFKFNTAKKKCGLELHCAGLPWAKVRQLVQVTGLAKRDSGNWYVSKVSHDISRSDGAITSLECNRNRTNAGNTKGGSAAGTVNKKTAAESTDNKKEVLTVNAQHGEQQVVKEKKK